MSESQQKRKDDLHHLKNVLRDAPYCCKKIIYLNQEIERMEYELTGMARHSIPMTKEQERSALPMPRFHGGGMTLVERIAEIDAVKDERSYYEKRLRECSVIEWLDPEQQELIFKVFFLKMNQWDLSADLGITRRALISRVDTILKSVLSI